MKRFEFAPKVKHADSFPLPTAIYAILATQLEDRRQSRKSQDMRDKRPVDELSIAELERILAIRKRALRQDAF